MSGAIDDAMAAINAGIDSTAGGVSSGLDPSTFPVPPIPPAGGAPDSFANSTLGQMLPGWLGGSFTPAAGGSLQGALSTLSKAQNPGGGSEKLGGPAPMNMQGAQAPQGAGTSRGNVTLANLLAALDARRNLLLQSAVSGQARPVANPASPYEGGATRQTTGLLGI
jgi:hypothetical protein